MGGWEARALFFCGKVSLLFLNVVMKWKRCLWVLLGESLLSLCPSTCWTPVSLPSLFSVVREECELSWAWPLLFVSLSMEVLVRWRLCGCRGDVAELPARFQGLTRPSLVVLLKMFISLIHISNNLIEVWLSYPMHCLIEIYYLDVLIQNVPCSDIFFVYSEFWTDQPNSFLKNILIAAPIEISIKPQTYVSLGNC